MKPEIRDIWKAALTSGEYEQGVGALRSEENKFCCLGVLCDIYIKTTGKARWDGRVNHDHAFVDDNGSRSSGFLTESVRKWADLPSSSPDVDGHYLHAMNDVRVPFSKIAEKLDEL